MSKTLTDLINTAGGNPSSTIIITNPVLVEAAENLTKERQKKAVAACQGLLESFTGMLASSVQSLRQLRKEARQQEVNTKKLDRALRYFAETGNPLPVFDAQQNRYGGGEWCRRAGIAPPVKDDPAWTVPIDWKPAEAAPAIDGDADPVPVE